MTQRAPARWAGALVQRASSLAADRVAGPLGASGPVNDKVAVVLHDYVVSAGPVCAGRPEGTATVAVHHEVAVALHHHEVAPRRARRPTCVPFEHVVDDQAAGRFHDGMVTGVQRDEGVLTVQ